MKQYDLHEPMYRTDITIIVDCDYATFAAMISTRHPNELLYSWDQPFILEDGTDGYEFHVNGVDGELFYVWIEKPDVYMLAHEFHHLTHDVLFTREIRCGYGTEEVFAYLNGRLREMYEEALVAAVRGDNR